MKELLLLIVLVFIFAYLSNFKENKYEKILIFQRKLFSIGKKHMFYHWECLLLLVVTI